MMELRATQRELAGQKEELANQNATATLARFENSFFSLLEAQRVIASKIGTRGGTKTNVEIGASAGKIPNYGVPYFEQFIHSCVRPTSSYSSDFLNVSELKNLTEDEFRDSYLKQIEDRKSKFSAYFEGLDEIKSGKFDSYFRITYRILKFIDEYDFINVATMNIQERLKTIKTQKEREEEKDREIDRIKNSYVGILRAQIGAWEQVAIFYNALSYSKAKNLYQKYALFNTLRYSNLDSPRDLLLYNVRAFHHNVPSLDSEWMDEMLSELNWNWKYSSGEIDILDEETFRRIYNIWSDKNFL